MRHVRPGGGIGWLSWSGALVMALGLAVDLGCTRWSPEQRAYVEELVRFRSAKDRLMASEDGPLTPAQRDAFKGLAYFGPRFDWILEAPLEFFAHPDTVRLPTSQGTFDTYVRAARLRFRHGSRDYALTVFRSLDGTSWFVPFMDRTNGDTTYGAGRYVDLEELEDGRFRLDFNRAYNPYCAYNHRWVCPIPPAENRLDVAIEAGERTFPYSTDVP